MNGTVTEKKGTFIVGWEYEGEKEAYKTPDHDDAARVYWEMDEAGLEPVMGFYGYFLFVPERTV